MGFARTVTGNEGECEDEGEERVCGGLETRDFLILVGADGPFLPWVETWAVSVSGINNPNHHIGPGGGQAGLHTTRTVKLVHSIPGPCPQSCHARLGLEARCFAVFCMWSRCLWMAFYHGMSISLIHDRCYITTL